MKQYASFFLIVFTFIISSCNKHAPKIEWEKTLGGSLRDAAWSIIQTKNSGYIVAGVTSSDDGDVKYNHGFSDYWVVKLNSLGALQWEKCYGGSYFEGEPAVLQTMDGGYVLAGHTYNFDGDVRGFHGWADWWVVKIDSAGNIQWQNALGGKLMDITYNIVETSDSGYALAGSTSSTDGDVTNNHGKDDTWVVKLDKHGNIKWEKCFGGSESDGSGPILQTSDGGFIVASASYSTDGNLPILSDSENLYLFKLNASGEMIWKKNFSAGKSSFPAVLLQTPDHNFIVAGTSSSKVPTITSEVLRDMWVSLFDEKGNLKWLRHYGGALNDQLSTAIQSDDGNILVGGSSNSVDGNITGNRGGNDGWLFKLDQKGDIIWQENFGGSGDDAIQSIRQTKDGGYILAGLTESSDGDISLNKGNTDLWIIKLSPDK